MEDGECRGVKKIFLSGYTPLPVDRFGRERKDFVKVALNSQKSVAWEYVKNPASLIKRLKKEGFHIVAIEQSKKSVDYKKLKLKSPFCFLLAMKWREPLKTCSILSTLSPKYQ